MNYIKPIIYLISDGSISAQNFQNKTKKFLQIVRVAVECKIPLIQIREKLLPTRLVFELTSQTIQIAKNSDTKILVNDRADVALAAKADGVHLTSNSISAGIIRQNFRPNLLIGVSAHTLEEVQKAKKQGADFVTFSPIYPSPDKGKPLGLDVLRIVCENVKPFPVIALGGIDETNYNEALQIADGFAAIRFLNNPENLRKLKDENLFINRRS